MRLKTKLPLYTSLILFFSILTVAILSILEFRAEINKSIKSYRREATNTILNHLKDIVNIAYYMIDNAYHSSTPEALKLKYGFELQDSSFETIRMLSMNIMKITLENIRVIRYGKDGYIWINEFNPPYKVILHPIKPELEGKAWVFYIENTEKNVYEAFHDTIVEGRGAGRVSYNFYKPGTKEKIPKISWVRLYEPLNWVIGTGVYVDFIDKIVAQKKAALNQQVRNLIIIISLIGIFFIVLSSLMLYAFAKTITGPLGKIEEALLDMAKGKIPEEFELHRKDEIATMKQSLDKLIEGFKRYSEFAEEIGKGNFEAHFEKLSDEDLLGNALLQMRDNLAEARRREELQREKDAKRRWINEGLSKFSDIITISRDVETLAVNVITKLVDFIDATQGGMFIIAKKEDGYVLELKAAVAYNRRKYIKKELELDEGLVGACFMEKEPIYITDLPDEYLEIRSGLGGAMPKNLYLVPLKYENKVYGVIEIASFNIFEDHHREFIASVAQMVAVSLSTKINLENVKA